MTEKEKWEIAISIISTTITLVTLIYSIILGRKANSRKLKIIKKLYDKDNKECKNGINCSSIYVYLTNIGNRNIKIYNLKIEINYRNKLDLNSIIYSNNNKLNVDEI